MLPEQPQTPASRRYIVTAVKLVVSIALLAFLLSRIDIARLWANARQASIPWLAIALAVYLSTVLCSVWRWWLLLEAQDVDVAPRQLFNSYLVALFFNNLLPSNIGGDVVRISDTAKARAVEDAGDDRRAARSRDGRDGPGARRRLRSDARGDQERRRSCRGPAVALLVLGQPAVLVLGRLRRRRGGHDARARRAGRRRVACCSR